MNDQTPAATVEVVQPTSRREWLAMRRQDVTASQIGALLQVHPFCTRLQLFLEKTGRKTSDDDLDSAAMRRGRMLERLAFEQAAEALPAANMEHNLYNRYWRDRALRIGCTPDVIADDKRGRGVIQLKSVEPSIYRRTWEHGEPPVWVALQAMTEAKLVGASWAAVGVLRVGHGVEFDLIDVPLVSGAWAAVLEAVKGFWDMVELGVAPPPDFTADGELIAALTGTSEPGSTIDLSGDNALTAVLHDREELKALQRDTEKQLEAYDAQIRFKVGAAEVATVGDFRITLKTEQVKGYTVAARERRPIRIKRIRGPEASVS